MKVRMMVPGRTFLEMRLAMVHLFRHYIAISVQTN